MESTPDTSESMSQEVEELRRQLYEANETIEAIRTGQVDALVVQGESGHQLYTLQTADHAYRVFIEKMTEGAITLNEQGLILYANSQFAVMVGLPLSEVIGVSFQQFIAPQSYELYQQLLATCWNGDCKGEVELSSVSATIPVQLSLTPLQLEGVSLSVILTDLTLQKAAQKQLQEKAGQLEKMNQSLEASNHDLQQFASVASHDLQEPLRKILMFATLIKERSDLKSNEIEGRYVEKIIHAAGRMRSLIVDVLNYSKLSSRDGDFAPVDLNLVLTELLEDFELMIQEKGARITATKLPVIDANKGQMRQVFQNILSNALKFSKEGEAPAIHITAKRIADKSLDGVETSAGKYCLLSIKDNGIGFDEKYVENVFSLFERLHSKDHYEGTGIGLAITKKIVERHNGLVSAKSVVGNGAEFLIILPLKQTHAK